METSLREIRPGMRAVVTEIRTDDALRRRLRDFGLVPGPAVRCRYKSPWGDVAALEFRGAVLALREKDLGRIRVRC